MVLSFIGIARINKNYDGGEAVEAGGTPERSVNYE
jgi:hypothetical protein